MSERRRSQELDLTAYDTDKVANGYLAAYDPFFAPLIDQPITLLELGIFKGGSLRLWRDYFPRASIVGIDKKLPEDLSDLPRIRVFGGRQDDLAFLSQIAAETAPQGFDIIIDDASHTAAPTRAAFWHLFDHHLKPGGLYVIEDWGTGYWSDWPDGRTHRPPGRLRGLVLSTMVRCSIIPPIDWHSHGAGMVGFIKELIDEQGAMDLTRGSLAARPGRPSKFAAITVLPSLVFIRKRDGAVP